MNNNNTFKPAGSEYYTVDDFEKEIGRSNREIAVNHMRIAKQIMVNMEFARNVMYTFRPFHYDMAELHIRIAEFHINLAMYDKES